MKSRNSLVSNSSSSSFIIQSKDIKLKTYLSTAISDNCFCATIHGLRKDFVWPKEIYRNERWKVTIPQPEENEYDGSKTHHIDFHNCDDILMDQILKLVKENSEAIAVYTGGTDSRLEPQTYLQSVLIDLGIDYKSQGDGSFDLRNSEDVKDVLKSYQDKDGSNYLAGAVKLILDKFSKSK